MSQSPLGEAEARALLDQVFTGGLDEAGARQIATGLATGETGVAGQVSDVLRRASLLFEVANAVSDSLSLDELLPRLIQIITMALDADRATLFLHDPETGELFSRLAQGDGIAEIRIPSDRGIAGAVFTAGRPEIIDDAYADSRFNQEVDKRTGYRTCSILAVPVRNRAEAVIGVTQVLNKRSGCFGVSDRVALEALTRQAAAALEHARLFERLERARRDEARLIEVAESISSELDLDALLARIVQATTQLLDAERSTLFFYDAKLNQLWSRVAEGSESREIRIPVGAGIAGSVFGSGQSLNIPDAYADPRFNQEVDKRTGFRTRSILCVPIADRQGKRVGVVQVLNKRGGPFTAIDEMRLRAVTSQMAVAMQNAQLFADVLQLKNYNESILKSLSNGVITLDDELKVVKVNEAAQRILGLGSEEWNEIPAAAAFGETNPWLLKSLDGVVQGGGSDYRADIDLARAKAGPVSVNLTVEPLNNIENRPIGYMLVIEDITREKRVRSTMARYMAKEIVDRLLADSEEMLQGTTRVATVLFSDIRRFTSLAEALTARATVKMLNEYFTAMVDVVFRYGGILDKYIGDAIMAVFGAPLSTPEDADNAVKVANEMLRALNALNRLRETQGLLAIDIGIGLATGEVLAGSVGSAKRMEYTVIGDSVNLASRLESATKAYGVKVLVADSTVATLREPHRLRRIDQIRVKGKLKPTEVYELLDYCSPDLLACYDQAVPLFDQAIDNYLRRDWTTAAAGFNKTLALVPNDPPSKLYIERCRYYADHPPPDDWDGVWEMKEK